MTFENTSEYFGILTRWVSILYQIFANIKVYNLLLSITPIILVSLLFRYFEISKYRNKINHPNLLVTLHSG